MSATSQDVSQDELSAWTRRSFLIGRFKVLLKQTQKHHDQRGLDQDWVDSLVEQIGSPEVLDRANHPLGVILKDDTSVGILLDILASQTDKSNVPELPRDLLVYVFAGQHRLAMLARLGLPEPEQQWWHADVYMHELESKHPGEFLTMMHESNTPQVMKRASDVDLFQAVVRLRRLVDKKEITWAAFLQHRRSLLNFDTNLARSISSLTRDLDLANSIMEALTRPHIADTFSAGSWRRLTTGRLYMVATGLVHEMIAQVDLLTQGMYEVPKTVLSVAASRCKVSSLEDLIKDRTQDKSNKKKNKHKKIGSHPWDILPGGLAAALTRVKSRPKSLVTTLNPKKDGPWSLPDLVLIPACLGGSIVEDELKVTQNLTRHLLKMTARSEDLTQYNSTATEKVEGDVYHPAGILADIIRAIHLNADNLTGYENRILQKLWSHRAELSEHLDLHSIPAYDKATREDYERLLESSKPWWDLLRLFKTSKFPFGLRLACPKTFDSKDVGSGCNDKLMMVTEESTSGPSHSQRAGLKRSQDTLALGLQGSRKQHKSSATEGPSHKQRPDEETYEEDTPNQIGNQARPGSEEEDHTSVVSERRGHNRRLNKAIRDVKRVAGDMNWRESRALTTLLNRILNSQQSGDLEVLLGKMLDDSKSQNNSDEKSQTGSETETEETE